jgi:hypothetical protein
VGIFEVFTAVKIQVEVFWVVTSCGVAVRKPTFPMVKMDAAKSSETF